MYIHVKVTANARTESVEDLGNNRFKISVREKAERNMANERVVRVIAGEFRTSVKNVRIIHGHHSPAKLISVNVGD